MLSQITLEAQGRDPRLPFQEVPPGLEYQVAAPLIPYTPGGGQGGPWFWQWPYGSPHLPYEAFYNPRTYPFPARTGGFLPRWSGSFIQQGNLDPHAYKLVYGSGQLSGEEKMPPAFNSQLGVDLELFKESLQEVFQPRVFGLMLVGSVIASVVTRKSKDRFRNAMVGSVLGLLVAKAMEDRKE